MITYISYAVGFACGLYVGWDYIKLKMELREAIRQLKNSDDHRRQAYIHSDIKLKAVMGSLKCLIEISKRHENTIGSLVEWKDKDSLH